MQCGPDLLDALRRRGKQPNEKEGHKTPLPGRALQIGQNAAILHQGFKRIGGVSESMDRDAIHNLMTGRTRRMRANDMHFELVDKAPIQFMNETRLMIPAAICG